MKIIVKIIELSLPISDRTSRIALFNVLFSRVLPKTWFPAKMGNVEVVQHGWFGRGTYPQNQCRISVKSDNLTCNFAIFMLAPPPRT